MDIVSFKCVINYPFKIRKILTGPQTNFYETNKGTLSRAMCIEACIS